MKKLLLTSLLISSIVSASFAQDAVFLPKGTPAPYEGILMPKERVQEFRNQELELEAEKKLVESYKRSVDLYKTNEEYSQQQRNILVERNDKLSKELMSAKDTSDLQKMLLIGFGVLITGVAIRGVQSLR